SVAPRRYPRQRLPATDGSDRGCRTPRRLKTGRFPTLPRVTPYGSTSEPIRPTAPTCRSPNRAPGHNGLSLLAGAGPVLHALVSFGDLRGRHFHEEGFA